MAETSRNTQNSNNQPYLVNIEESPQQNHHLDKQVKSKESELKKLRESETHLKSELCSLKQKYDAQMQLNQNLKSDLEYTRKNSVLNCTDAEVPDQNRTLAKNIVELIHRNEELEKEVSLTITHKLSKASAQNLVVKSDLRTECGKLQLLRAENEGLSLKNESSDDLYQNTLNKNKTLETLNKNLSEEKSYLENFNHKISVRNDILEVENQILSEKARKLEDENNERKEGKRQTESEIHELKIKLRERDCRIQNLRGELGSLSRGQKLRVVDPYEVAKLKQELNCKRKALDAEVATTNGLMNQIKTLQTQVESLQREVERYMNTIRSQRADHKDQLETKSNSIAALQKLLKDTEHKEQRTDAAVKMLRVQVDSMSKEKDDLNQQLKDKQEQIETLSSMVDMKGTSESVNHERFLESNRELESQNKKLKHQLEENGTLIKAQKKEINHQQLVVQVSKNSLTKQEAKVKALEKESKEKDAKLKILEDDAKKKNEKLKKLEKQLGESATLPQTQKEKIANLKLLVNTQKKRLAEKNAKVKELEEAAILKDAKVKNMKKAAIRKEETVNKLREKAAERATHVKILEDETKGMDEKLEELKESINSQATYVKHLESQLENLNLDNYNLQWELDKEKNQRKRMIDPTQIQVQNEMLLKIEEKVAAANENIKEMKESLEESQNDNSEILPEKANLPTNMQKFPSQGLSKKKAELNRSLEMQSPNLKVANEAIICNLRSQLRSLPKLSGNRHVQSAIPKRHLREGELCGETQQKKMKIESPKVNPCFL